MKLVMYVIVMVIQFPILFSQESGKQAPMEVQRFYIRGGGYVDGYIVEQTENQFSVRVGSARVVLDRKDVTAIVSPKKSKIKLEVTLDIREPVKKTTTEKTSLEQVNPQVNQGKNEKPADSSETVSDDVKVPKDNEARKDDLPKPGTQSEPASKQQTPNLQETGYPWSKEGKDFVMGLADGSIKNDIALQMAYKNPALITEMMDAFASGSEYDATIRKFVVDNRLYNACDSLMAYLGPSLKEGSFVAILDLFIEMKYRTAHLSLKEIRKQKGLSDVMMKKIEEFDKRLGKFDEGSAVDWLSTVSPLGYGRYEVQNAVNRILAAESEQAKDIIEAIDYLTAPAKEIGLIAVGNSAKEGSEIGAKLIEHIKDDDMKVRAAAIIALSTMKYVDSQEALENLYASEEERFVKVQICYAMGRFKTPAATTFLIKMMRDPDEDIRLEAENQLRLMTGQNLGRDPESWEKWWAHNNPESMPEEEGKTEVPGNK